MKEYMVEVLYPWGVVYKFHVEAEDGGVAWNAARIKAMNRPGAQSRNLKMVSIEEGKLTDLGWKPYRPPIIYT